MNYRLSIKEDIPLLIELRKRQLIDEGQNPDVNMDQELVKFFNNHFADNTLVEWVAEEDGKIVGTAAILFFEFPPAFTNPSGIKGYITNMFTVPEYRGQGLASELLKKVLDEARSRSVKNILLAASDMGKPVYKKVGFEEAGDWMKMNI
jgi:GNAT superfamily N-acetyltransferase